MNTRQKELNNQLIRLVAAYCNAFPKAVDALAEMLPEERADYVLEIAIAILQHVPAQVLTQYDSRTHLGS